jgi:hypothetical protein
VYSDAAGSASSVLNPRTLGKQAVNKKAGVWCGCLKTCCRDMIRVYAVAVILVMNSSSLRVQRSNPEDLKVMINMDCFFAALIAMTPSLYVL